MIVVHPCNHIREPEADRIARLTEYNLEFYRRLIPYAEEFGIKIAIENVPNAITVTAEALNALLTALDNPIFTVCFDVGHAHLCGIDPAEMIRKLGSRIGCTHIHDNTGTADAHTLPFYGTINWESVMKALADTGYNGNLNYEAGNFVRDLPEVLRPDAAGYMATVGRHLIERFAYYQEQK